MTTVTLTRVDHIGIPVRDLDRSLAFYQKLSGMLPVFIDNMHSPAVSRGINVQDARLRFSIIRLENVTLEFIEYQSPRGQDYDRHNNDVGAIHIAFQVDNIQAVYDSLVEQGVHFHAAPHTFTDADGSPSVVGGTFAYFLDPDGIQLEIFQPVP